MKKYPILLVTRFFLWNVVSVSVTVSAESISQFGFWFRYWTETKIVVLVVHYIRYLHCNNVYSFLSFQPRNEKIDFLCLVLVCWLLFNFTILPKCVYHLHNQYTLVVIMFGSKSGVTFGLMKIESHPFYPIICASNSK